MGDVSRDLVTIMTTASIGYFPGDTDPDNGWEIFISQEPTTPDTTITLFNYSAGAPNPKWLLDDLGVQVRVRGAVNGYAAAEVKTQAIKDALLGYPKTTINSSKYIGIWTSVDAIFLGYDDSNRPVFVSSWRVIREPSSGTNRTAL